jgi:hypothetical protein
MPANRLSAVFREQAAISAVRLAEAADPRLGNFAGYPVAIALTPWQQQIYLAAWERVRQTLAPPRSLLPNAFSPN